jgi:hypothetical protein
MPEINMDVDVTKNAMLQLIYVIWRRRGGGGVKFSRHQIPAHLLLNLIP